MTLDWQLLVVILEVAVGLGMVIFVHELGHFVVAKLCNVKCEKFYLGFDIYGLKLAKFKWGETEYGIGILPLGGYVKMLGQDDNPARAAQERDRSRIQVGGVVDATAQAVPSAGQSEAYKLDPRSYMAKSVPQRMAIISAGVIMNVIFACAMAAVAYSLGVTEQACGVSSVQPGEAAWRANMHPGDMFVAINDSGGRPLRYRDLMQAVALGNLEKGITFEVKRPGDEKPFPINVKPDLEARRMRPTIGVLPPLTTKLADSRPVIAGTPAGNSDAFRPGDLIVSVGGVEVSTYPDIDSQLTRHPGESLRFTVKREPNGPKENDGTQAAADPKAGTQFDVELPPQPMRTLGLVMKMGKITAIQVDSPAARADIRAGDFITAIDGQTPGDPLRLPDQLRRRAGETIELSISREGPAGEDAKLDKKITLREQMWSEESEMPGSPVSVPALGLTYKVLNIVHTTDKGSPAAQAELTIDGKPASVPLFAARDEIVKAHFKLPEISEAEKARQEADESKAYIAKAPEDITLSEKEPNWPFLMNQLQRLPKGTTVTLTLKDGRTTTLTAADAGDWFYAERGFLPMVELTFTQAHSAGEAISMGGRETIDSVLQVYAFLRRIGSQVSPYMLGGPKTIAETAGRAAYRGLPDLLIFLTVLSANLAVVNFLPIPLLDGGHMVFLLLEGIFRRPVSEKVVVAFHYLGFVFIISLMLFVLGLDFGLIPRPH
jgi:regulator of sigma E protease